MTCLPDALFTDPYCLYLRKRKRRHYILLLDMERVRGQWDASDVARWTEGLWASVLGVSESQFARDLAYLRQLGIMEEESITLRFCRPAPQGTEVTTEEFGTAGSSSSPHAVPPASRRRYPSDLNRKRGMATAEAQPTSAVAVSHEDAVQTGTQDAPGTPHGLRRDSAETPQTGENDSAETPQTQDLTPPISKNDSARTPHTGFVEGFLADGGVMAKSSRAREPVACVREPESGTGTGSSVLKFKIPESGPVPVVEEFVRLGMTEEKARRRLTEYGEERCSLALRAVGYVKAKTPSGWIVDFLRNHRPVPPALAKEIAQEQQERLTLLTTSRGGVQETPVQAERRQPDLASGIASIGRPLAPPPCEKPSPAWFEAHRQRVRAGGAG